MRDLLDDYLRKFNGELKAAARTGEYTVELSYRPVTHEFLKCFLKTISSSCSLVFEPRQQAGAGRPDWRLYNSKSLAVYAYGEAKPFNSSKPLTSGDYDEQLKRYLALGYPVFLTNGVEFLFMTPERSPEIIKIGSVRKGSITLDERDSQRLEGKFREILNKPLSRPVTEDRLISEVAHRAKEIAQDVQELVKLTPEEALDPGERETIKVLHELQIILSEHHDQTLRSPEVFSEFVAQVLIFGLYYAFRVTCLETDEPVVREKKLRDYWMAGSGAQSDQRLRPIRAMVTMLNTQLYSLNRIGAWYGDCLALLAHSRLAEPRGRPATYHDLYERFFTEFSPQGRFDFGAFYTPMELAAFSLHLVELVLSSKNQDILLYAENNKLIDPCCGTGTFLELLIARVRAYETQPLIAGFEILPAPYALANYRLGMLDLPSKISDRVKILLTNTLSDALADPSKSGGGLVGEEQKSAHEVAKKPLTLIIGNPPSSDSPRKGSDANFTHLDRLIDDFRPHTSLRKGRSNLQKQLQNAFVYFLRWASAKLDNPTPGILAFIVPETLLRTPSYATVREWFSNFYDEIWILKIDADARRGALTDNLFNTRQGRALILGVKNIQKIPTKSIWYLDISQLSRSDKYSFLSIVPTRKLEDMGFVKLEASTWTPRTRSKSAPNTLPYSSFLPLCDAGEFPALFLRHCSGIKIAPSSLAVHVDAGILRRRCRELGDSRANPEALHEKWFKGQRKPFKLEKMDAKVRAALASAATKNSFVGYTYRPFVYASAVLTHDFLDALSQTPGAGTRSRPEIQAAFSRLNNPGIAVAPSPAEIGETLTRFASYCWAVPDNDTASRGNAHIFCGEFPSYGSDKNETNIHPKILDAYEVRQTNFAGAARTLTNYAYAILSSTTFHSMYHDELYAVGQWPRLPMPKRWSSIEEIAKLGLELAELEDLTKAIKAELKITTPAVMAAPLTNAQIEPLSQKIVLLNERNVIVTIEGVPQSVLTHRISGYNVIKEWIKYRTWPYYRAMFTQRELDDLSDLLNRIHLQLLIIDRINKHLEPMLSNPNEFLDFSH